MTYGGTSEVKKNAWLPDGVAGRGERRLALGIVLLALIVFLVGIPLASQPVDEIAYRPAFAAQAVMALLVAILLADRFSTQCKSAFLVLACAYGFMAYMALGLQFLWSAARSLGEGGGLPWFYLLWHGGLALGVAGYVLLKARPEAVPGRSRVRGPLTPGLAAFVAVVAFGAGGVWLVSGPESGLPALVDHQQYTTAMDTGAWLVGGLGLLALAGLAWRRPYTSFDVWLMVASVVGLFDVVLSAVLASGPFDLGFYAGHVFGLVASACVLAALLTHLAGRAGPKALARQQLAAIVGSANEAIIGESLQGTITSWNDGAQRIFGYRAEEVVGRSIRLLYPAELAAKADTLLSRVSTGETIQHFETTLCARDGRQIEVSVSLSPLCDRSGRVIGAARIASDISERKLAEKEKREWEMQFRQIVETMNEGMWTLDADLRTRFVNQQMASMLGFRPEEMLGRPTADFVFAEDLAADRERMAARQQGVAERYERRWRRKDGSACLCLVSAVPSYASDGSFAGATAMCMDISAVRQAEQAVRDSNERFELFASTVDEVFWMADNDLRKTQYISPAYERIWGRSCASLYANPRSYLEAIHPDDLERVIANTHAAHLAGQPFEHEYRVQRPDGALRWVWDRGFPVSALGGKATRYVGVAQDITGRHELESSLRQAASVLESTGEGIAITDLDGTIKSINPAFTTITGYSGGEALGRNMRLLQSSRHDRSFYQNLWQQIAATGHWQGEIWNRRKNGEIFPEWQTISTVRAPDGKPVSYVTVFSDISHIKNAEARLDHLAHHDALTGLPNRLMLLSRLEHAIEHGRRTRTLGAVLFMDLDRFKNVNDSLGHPAGDELLIIVAERLRAQLRESDLLARLGGDEFIVLLEDLHDPGDVAEIAQGLIAQMCLPFRLQGGQAIYLGTSIGISLFPGDSDEAHELIQFADTALYQAKHGGGNAFRFFTESFGAEVSERLSLESALRSALENKEFTVHYQPLVHLEDRRIFGVEALLRWDSPQQGLVLPTRFIPLAEGTGLIIPLGEWVLRTACCQAREWRDAGQPLSIVAVNVSPCQFRQDNFVERVGAILAESGLPPGCLELELTEGALMEPGNEAEARLAGLKALGLRLSIDDFGTGYSSLAYLKRFPIDKLKIDQSFVRDIPGDCAGMEIVATIVAMAHNLKVSVLAEGIESEAQLAYLQECGCPAGQGYLFSRPLLPAQIVFPPPLQENEIVDEVASDQQAEGTILVVDDEPISANVLTRLLRKQGYAVRTADNGETALRMADAHPPDLILLDINMPGMDGYATCRRLKADPENSAIPVIFISGEGRVVNKVEAFASGGVDFLAKPLNTKEILARVRTHLALRRLQQHLEERVSERTAELEATVAELARQIAERELVETALREREARLRRLVEANIIGVMVWTIDGAIIDANDAFLRMLAYDRKDLAAGRIRWDRLTPPEYQDSTALALAELTRNGVWPPYEKEYLRQDGSRVPVLVGSALVDGESEAGISFVLDLSERRGFEQQLLESHERLRELAAHRDAVREQERKRIAREIHDELGSLLTALKMDISLTRMNAGEDAALQGRLAQMHDLVDQTIRMVRQVASQLRPAALNLGIVPALEWLVQEFGERTGLACTLTTEGEIAMDDAQATAIFRIVQESLTNIARHAEASHVTVSLLHQGDEMVLCIADDGRGFNPECIRHDAFGLLGIRERAQALSARAEVVSTPGNGCTVTVKLPLVALVADESCSAS